MKARCPQCGWTASLTSFPEPGNKFSCPDCGTSFYLEAHLILDFGEIHVTQEVESFIVEWQLHE